MYSIVGTHNVGNPMRTLSLLLWLMCQHWSFSVDKSYYYCIIKPLCNKSTNHLGGFTAQMVTNVELMWLCFCESKQRVLSCAGCDSDVFALFILLWAIFGWWSDTFVMVSSIMAARGVTKPGLLWSSYWYGQYHWCYQRVSFLPYVWFHQFVLNSD